MTLFILKKAIITAGHQPDSEALGTDRLALQRVAYDHSIDTLTG